MGGTVTLRIFRYTPGPSSALRYDRFRVPGGERTTVLDALSWIQAHEDPTLAFRYACRVGMCGSCAMVVSGRERWACRTLLTSLRGREVTVRPLYHFPVVKDLVVDMAPFQERMQRIRPAVVPAVSGEGFIRISAESAERRAIDPAIECIGCGACVSACTMAHWRPEFPGPAALLRAFTLVEDSREAGRDRRLAGLLSEEALWHCHTQVNCAVVCPMELNPTEAIEGLKRKAVSLLLLPRPTSGRAGAPVPIPEPASAPRLPRRGFLRGAVAGLAAALAVPLAGILGVGLVGRRSAIAQWVRVGPVPILEPGRPQEVRYEVPIREQGQARALVKRAYLVRTRDGLVAFDPQCTHLGCATHWDEATRLFLCPCHGGGYDLDGRVVMGPPPRPLRRLGIRTEGTDLDVKVG